MTSNLTHNPSDTQDSPESVTTTGTTGQASGGHASGHADDATPAADRPGHVRVRRGNVHDAEELRRAFLQAASTIFAEGGLEAVSMRAVAAAVGVSPMTPYRYFADKAELLTGLWDQATAALLSQVRAAVDAAPDARAKLRAHLDSWIAYWEAHPDQYRLVYMTERTTRREDRGTAQQSPVYAQLLQLAQETLRDLAREIGVSDANVVVADEVRLMMAMGFLHATMVNRRYPWSDVAKLRGVFMEETLAAVERILRHGPQKAPGA